MTEDVKVEKSNKGKYTVWKDRYNKMQGTLELERSNHKKEIEEKDKKLEEAKNIFNECLARAMPIFMSDSFSEGYLADDLKYKLCASRRPTSKEITLLIEKLQFDKKIILEFEAKAKGV